MTFLFKEIHLMENKIHILIVIIIISDTEDNVHNYFIFYIFFKEKKNQKSNHLKKYFTNFTSIFLKISF